MTVNDLFKNMRVLHGALLVGQVMIFVVVYVFVERQPAKNESWPMLLVGVATAVGIIGGHLLFTQRLKQAMTSTNLSDKLSEFKAALVIRYATLEGPFLLTLVCFVAFGLDHIWLTINAVTSALFLVYTPTVRLAISLLKLDYTDAQILEDGNTVL